MRKKILFSVLLAQAFLMSGCAAAWQSAQYSDDLYAVHNKIAIANRQKAEAELAKAQYEAQQAQYEATLAKIKAEAAKNNITVTEGSLSSGVNGYNAVLADTYESAYARRLYGFSSPTYRMPSSYYDWRYSDAFHYVSAYDPAMYNIMISGDMVWVEPKYITSMFGTWGAVAVPSYSWYYGWNDPYFYWGSPYRYDWRWNFYYGYNPYWGWGYPYYPHYHHHHHPPHHNHPPHHKPPYAGSGSVGSTGHHHNRPGMVVGRNPGASRPADRVASPSKPSNRVSKPTVRDNKVLYRGGSSNSSSPKVGSTTYRSSSPSYKSNSYNSTPSFRSSSSSGGFSSSSSGGHSSGGYSGGGGNARGR